jgi:hypothetical protein
MRIRSWIGKAAIVLPAVAGGFAQAGEQPCSETAFERAGAYLKIDDFRPQSDDGVVVAAACKRWSGKDGLTLAAFAYGGAPDDVKYMAIFVFDDKRGKVVAAYRHAIDEGATMLGDGDARLDTAAYDLAPGVRAFGIDVGNDYVPHCAEGGAGPSRTLYVLQGRELRPVMKDMPTSAWRFDSKGSTTCSSDPAPVVNYTLTIAVDKAVTHGYADLVVTALGRRDDGKKTGRAPFRYRMRYDGKQYPVDMMMGEFSVWQA